jgi:hypothetical protein
MSDELKTHICKIYAQIGEAAKNTDLPSIQRLTRQVAELEELKQQQAAIQQRMAKLIHDEVTASVSPMDGKANGKLRELPVQVSEGMIRQNLLTLTPHVKRGRIKIGEELVIETLPAGEVFQTVVMEKGNKLRARGAITRFYQDAKVQADDHVLLTETAPGRWTLRKVPPRILDLSDVI